MLHRLALLHNGCQETCMYCPVCMYSDPCDIFILPSPLAHTHTTHTPLHTHHTHTHTHEGQHSTHQGQCIILCCFEIFPPSQLSKMSTECLDILIQINADPLRAVAYII